MKIKNVLLFVAFCVGMTFLGHIYAEQGDFSTLGYDTPNGRSYWRVDSSGYLKPGVTSLLDIGTSALTVRTIYVGAVTAATSVFTGQVSLQQASTTTLNTLTPATTGAIVFCNAYNTLCISTGVGAGAWVFPSTSTASTLVACDQ